MESTGARRGDGPPPPSRSWIVAAGRAVAPHPALWATALRQTLALARPGWWRSWPPLPVPPEGYLRFRLQTAYGGDGPAPDAGDVLTYLRWCRQWRALVGPERRD